MEKKTCSTKKGCGQEKEASEYSKIRGKLRHICKACQTLKARKYREENKEKEILRLSKKRAKKNNLEHNITLEDIKIPEYCPLLGIKIKREMGVSIQSATSPTLDRIDSSKGYIKGNIAIISWRANRLKSDASLEELETLVEGLKKLLAQQNEEILKITGSLFGG